MASPGQAGLARTAGQAGRPVTCPAAPPADRPPHTRTRREASTRGCARAGRQVRALSDSGNGVLRDHVRPSGTCVCVFMYVRARVFVCVCMCARRVCLRADVRARARHRRGRRPLRASRRGSRRSAATPRPSAAAAAPRTPALGPPPSRPPRPPPPPGGRPAPPPARPPACRRLYAII